MATNKLKTSSARTIHKKVPAADESKARKSSPPVTDLLSRPLLPGKKMTNAGIFLLLLFGTVVLYSGDLNIGFFSVDDDGYVISNPWIQEISFNNIRHILTTPYFLNYSPLHLLSYMFDYSINGADPYVFHLSSNIWAGLVGGFVFLAALALTGRHSIAIPAAVLFVVHPAHVEAVAWISSRKDLVAAAFALPALLAYLKYLQGGTTARRWYIASLVLYLVALSGKVSVATFPAVFVAIDLFLAKRTLLRSLLDKIPFIVLTAAFGIMVYNAQPLSGNNPSFYVFSLALLESFWLMTGLGEYVIYRLRPDQAGAAMEIASVVFLLAVFTAPLLLRKRFPIAVVFLYWILFSLLPAQLLSFVHPVTDRYLFFPSAGFVMLLCWAIMEASKKFKLVVAIPYAAMGVLAVMLTINTLGYLGEWRDPRSVWFAAVEKSSDPDVPYSLGGHYTDIAGRLGTIPRGNRLKNDELERFANAVWKEDSRLPALLSEWQQNKHGGPSEKAFQDHLLDLAWTQFERALATKGSHVLPSLYYKRGLLHLDKGNLPDARNEFTAALNEAGASSVSDTRDDVTINSLNALGAIAWRQNDYRQALTWFTHAEEEQSRTGKNIVPDIAERRNRMQQMVAMMGGTTGDAIDPLAAYNLGMYYLDASTQLGTPKMEMDAAERIAGEVWKTDARLDGLRNEWKSGQHNGPVEREFRVYLRSLAWDAFEKAARAKGKGIMPHLHFRRGMMLGEGGNLQAAEKEFLAALEDAQKEPNVSVQQEITVLSYDALGVLSWTQRRYGDAAKWFRIAQEKQQEYGGSWVPDIANKIRQVEALNKTGN
ncbi:MAG TPA: tetratricopeptide repeat protein [Flavisolibacter sp.]